MGGVGAVPMVGPLSVGVLVPGLDGVEAVAEAIATGTGPQDSLDG